MYFYGHLEDYIISFYTKMNITNPRELDFNLIAKKLKINIFYWNDRSQALFLKDHAFIFLNKHLSPEQQQQDFMHELCHILLHTGDQMRMSPLFRKYQENKATNFTYHACVPTFMLDNLTMPSNESKAIWMIQEMFHVELDFATKRLHQYLANQKVYVR